MISYIVMCRSLTYAQRAVRILERVGIIASISRAPRGLGTEGCAYSIKIAERRLNEALNILRSSGLSPGRVYRIDEHGKYTEVFA